MTRNNLLKCVQGGLQNHSYETTPRGRLVKTLRQCNIYHVIESTLPLKECRGLSWTKVIMEVGLVENIRKIKGSSRCNLLYRYRHDELDED